MLAALTPSLCLAYSPAPALPSTMAAVHLTHKLCFTPFTSCIKTHTVDVPSPGRGQVLIESKGSSVNPCDVDYVEYGVGCSGGGGTLGMDMAGTVVAVGDGVDRLKIGDDVWANTGAEGGDSGGMAQYAVINEAQAGLKPRSINFTEAATIPLVGQTALECLQRTGAPWSDKGTNLTVLITSGSGGTGFIGVQLAKRAFGAAHVITAASGEENIALMRQLGADVVVDYKVSDVFDATPDDSVDIVFDNYGAKGEADKAMRVVRPGGTYLLLPGGGGGTLSKHPKPGVTQVNFGYTNSSGHEQLDLMRGFFDDGKLAPHVFATFPLERAAEAYAMSKSGVVVGKVAVGSGA